MGPTSAARGCRLTYIDITNAAPTMHSVAVAPSQGTNTTTSGAEQTRVIFALKSASIIPLASACGSGNVAAELTIMRLRQGKETHP